MSMNDENAPDDEASVGRRKTGPRLVVGLGDQPPRNAAEAVVDTGIDDIEVVDLEARYTIENTLGQGGMGAVVRGDGPREGQDGGQEEGRARMKAHLPNRRDP